MTCKLATRAQLESCYRWGYFAPLLHSSDGWIDGPPTKARVRGPFAITAGRRTLPGRGRSRRYYFITHIPTGYKAGSGHASQDDAEMAVDRLLAIPDIDWYDASAVLVMLREDDDLRRRCQAACSTPVGY